MTARHPAWDTVHAQSVLLPEDHAFAAGLRELTITVLLDGSKVSIRQIVGDDPARVGYTLDWMVARLDHELARP